MSGLSGIRQWGRSHQGPHPFLPPLGRPWRGSGSNPHTLQQRRLALQFPRQRCDGRMLEDHLRHQGPPDRPYRILVAAPATALPEGGGDLLVGKTGQDPFHSQKVRQVSSDSN